MSTDLQRMMAGLTPEARADAIASIARVVERLRDEIVPAMEKFNEAFKRMQAASPEFQRAMSAHASGAVIDIRNVKVPPVPHVDPRQQALAARRNRNTGPSHHPYKHRGNR